jgi:YidC/Oxa1 family membrane protein insertase
MLHNLWFVALYQPVFNILIWIYTNIAYQNLGWAVVWLTIFLRIFLLPLTFLSERANERQKKTEEEALLAAGVYKNDPIAQKEAFRKLMKKHHVSPWARVLTLVLQAIVFLLLYQVFMHGISGDKILKTLYVFVDYPGKLNTSFYGFEIGEVHDIFWPTIVAVYLFVSIFIRDMKKTSRSRSNIYFLIFFPLFTWVILWFLPMVKALFILTTMVFSDIVSLIHTMFFSSKNKEITEDSSVIHH